MPELMQQSLRGAADGAPAWLATAQPEAGERWTAAPLPTRKTEAWKYTSLQPLEQDFAPAPAAAVEVAEANALLPDCGGARLVFVNGYPAPQLSTGALPEGVELVRFAEASDAQAALIGQHLDSVVARDQHLFATLNRAALTDGVFLAIAPGVTVSTPVQLVWLSAGEGAPFTVTQRLLVVAGANSNASVIEHFANTNGAQASFTNGVTELILQDGAILNHYRLQLEEGAAMHIGGVHARLERNSTCNSFHLGLGSDLKRIDVVVDHAGPGAHAEVNGLYLPRGSEHVDYHTCIEHRSGHCTSSETFRGVIADRASAVFNGRIHIHPQAQKTCAELSNKNLLTSASAEVNTKPELEIYADDVQCAHGATVAQLDELSMHYLRTRGISRAEAEVMLSFGFVNELLESLRMPILRDYLRPLIAARFARDPALLRHLV